MRTGDDADLIIAGGGLAGALIALRLRAERPDLRVLLLERGGRLGGEHVWSFFESDVADEDRGVLQPLITHRWPSYCVRFPEFERSLPIACASFSGVALHEAAQAALGRDVGFSCDVLDVGEEHVRLADGRTLRAAGVIDARGAEPEPSLALAWRKFFCLDAETAQPHGLSEPVMMDATVAQEDGYRAFKILPLSPTRLFIEDVRYSDSPENDRSALRAGVETYCGWRGWRIERVLSSDHGVLPIPLAGDIGAFWRGHETKGPARAGQRAGLFHPATGYALPDAVRLAGAIARLPDLSTPALRTLARDASVSAWERRGFIRYLNRLLFLGGPPQRRYRVLRYFNQQPIDLIERFHAGEGRLSDMVRLFTHGPPVGLPAAIGCISESRLLHDNLLREAEAADAADRARSAS